MRAVLEADKLDKRMEAAHRLERGIEAYAKDYARSLFDAYLDNKKTMAEISQELKQK